MSLSGLKVQGLVFNVLTNSYLRYKFNADWLQVAYALSGVNLMCSTKVSEKSSISYGVNSVLVTSCHAISGKKGNVRKLLEGSFDVKRKQTNKNKEWCKIERSTKSLLGIFRFLYFGSTI